RAAGPFGSPPGGAPAGLGGDVRRRRRGAALRAPPLARAVASRHGGLLRIQVYLHRRPPPGETSSPSGSSSRTLAMLAGGALAVAAFWDQAPDPLPLQVAIPAPKLVFSASPGIPLPTRTLHRIRIRIGQDRARIDP